MNKSAKPISKLLSVLPLVLILVLIIMSACEEREVFPIYDDDELDRYLVDTEEGRELFRTDDLFPDDEYKVPYDDAAVYHDVVDSVKRKINRWITPTYPQKEKDFGSYGVLRDAEYEIIDTLFVTAVRDSSGILTTTQKSIKLTRYGYFLKLGADKYPFNGWSLWGYNGGESSLPQSMMAKLQDGSRVSTEGTALSPFTYIVIDTFYDSNAQEYIYQQRVQSTNYKYARLGDIADLSGDSIVVFEGDSYPNRSYYHLLSAFTNDDYIMQQFDRTDSTHYLDTLRLANPNPHLWNVVLLHELRRSFPQNPPDGDTMVIQNSAWCFPYRIPQ